jgi:glycosyltransferase involved in cell wall biosynthesis
MRAVRVQLVIPCFNESRRLPVDSFRGFRHQDVDCHFLFVDDGSTDGTGDLLKRLRGEEPSRFSVLSLEENRGKAEAVRLGLLKAVSLDTDLVGFWDADLSTPLSEIPRFLEVFESDEQVEIIMGARVRLLGRSISRNPARHYFGRVGATLISSSLGLAVYDTQCGAKLFRVTDRLPALFRDPFLSRWIFDVEILARYVREIGRDEAARRIYELPLLVWQDVEGSKVRSTDFLRALRDLWKIHRAYRGSGAG